MKTNFSKLKICLSLIFIYVLFAELILPINKYFPKVSILMDSFISVFSNYALTENILSSVITLILGQIIAFCTFYFAAIYFPKIFMIFPDKKTNIAKIIFGIIFISLFQISIELNSLIFSLLLISITVFIIIAKNFVSFQSKLINGVYVKLAIKLNKNKNEQNRILVYSFMPVVKEKFNTLFYSVSILLILFEYIVNNYGLGFVFNHLFANHDHAGLFVLIIFTWFFFAAINWILTIIINRIIFWDSLNGEN